VVAAAALVVGARFLLIRRQRTVVIGTGAFAIVAQLACHPLFNADFAPSSRS